MAKVAILMGSKSDFPVVKPALEALKKFGVETEVRVISAHRTPDEAHAFAKDAEKKGANAAALTLFLAAQEIFPMSQSCREGISRNANAVLDGVK